MDGESHPSYVFAVNANSYTCTMLYLRRTRMAVWGRGEGWGEERETTAGPRDSVCARRGGGIERDGQRN